MADDRSDAGTPAVQQQAGSTAASSEPAKPATQAKATEEREERYAIGDLIEQAPQRFGVAAHAMVGALYGEERETLTLKQAQKALDDFLGRPVEPEPEESDS